MCDAPKSAPSEKDKLTPLRDEKSDDPIVCPIRSSFDLSDEKGRLTIEGSGNGPSADSPVIKTQFHIADAIAVHRHTVSCGNVTLEAAAWRAGDTGIVQ